MGRARDSGDRGERPPRGPHDRAGSRPDALRPAPELTPMQIADRALVIEVLAHCAGNQTRAAKQLGISRTTLVTKLRRYRIPRPRG